MTPGRPLRIVADENIAAVQEAFSPLGELRTFAARTLTREMLADADVLFVRSTTRVDAALLEGTPVRFVGSATAGVDHIDMPSLESRGIDFAYAPGSNAPAVADYCVAALLELAERQGFSLQGRTLGVVGVGHVGSRVVTVGEALGMRVICNDPPREEERGEKTLLRPIEEVLAQADIVTLHVPLTRDGRWPTCRMVDADWLGRLRPGAMLLNTARGDVVDEAALIAALRSGRLAAAALDVWCGEPAINVESASLAEIATPHIAGYSQEARLAGTLMIRDRLCAWMRSQQARSKACLPTRSGDIETHAPPAGATEDRLRCVVRQSLDLRGLTDELRAALSDPARPPFDALRRGKQQRREFSAFVVRGVVDERLREALTRLRFRVADAPTD